MKPSVTTKECFLAALVFATVGTPDMLYVAFIGLFLSVKLSSIVGVFEKSIEQNKQHAKCDLDLLGRPISRAQMATRRVTLAAIDTNARTAPCAPSNTKHATHNARAAEMHPEADQVDPHPLPTSKPLASATSS